MWLLNDIFGSMWELNHPSVCAMQQNSSLTWTYDHYIFGVVTKHNIAISDTRYDIFGLTQTDLKLTYKARKRNTCVSDDPWKIQ